MKRQMSTSDSRFKMDERFLEDDEEDDDGFGDDCRKKKVELDEHCNNSKGIGILLDSVYLKVWA